MAKNVVIVDDPATVRQILMRGNRAGTGYAAADSGGGEGAETFVATAFDLVLGDVDIVNQKGPVRC